MGEFTGATTDGHFRNVQTKRVGVSKSINLSKMTKHFIWELYNEKAHLEVDGVNKKENTSVLNKANHVLDKKALHALLFTSFAVLKLLLR